MSEPAIILTDGCTGFPDKIGSHDFTNCCMIHDDGGSDAALGQCLTEAAPGIGFGFAIYSCLIIMWCLRPAYNLLQRLGILPKTKGSKF